MMRDLLETRSLSSHVDHVAVQFENVPGYLGRWCYAFCRAKEYLCEAYRWVPPYDWLCAYIHHLSHFLQSLGLALAAQALGVVIAVIPHIRDKVQRNLPLKQHVLLSDFDRLLRVSLGSNLGKINGPANTFL